VSVELTDLGRAKHAEMLRAVQAFNRRLLSGLSEAEIEDLRALLARLEQNVRTASA
jgi:DNA-binding MarR family transcriptional regulator